MSPAPSYHRSPEFSTIRQTGQIQAEISTAPIRQRLRPQFGPAHLVVDKGDGEEEGDLNSRLHGNAKQQMEFAFRQFLQSQSRWELAGHRDMESASRFLHTSCLHLRLAIVQWIDTAVDVEAEKLVSTDAKPAALVRAGREYLTRVRDELVALLRYYQP